MIGNDIPGLRNIFEVSNAGVIVDSGDAISIKDGIIKIDKNHEFYKLNSRNIFDSIDNKKTINSVLKNIDSKRWKY